MGLISDMARRFGSTRHLPRSLVVMRAVAIAGIAIGTATLVVALSIVSGFQREYRRAILDFNAHVVVLEAGEMTDILPAVNCASGLGANKKGVIGITPFLYREGLAISKGIIKGIVVKGVDPKTIREVNQMRIDLVKGSSLDEALSSSNKNPNVILGKALAERLGIKITPPPTPSPSRGDQKITLMVPQTVKGKQFISAIVAGTFESGLYDYDSQFALMNIEDARAIFETGKIKATGIEIKLDDPEKAKAIASAMGNDLPSSYQAITWEELNRDLFEALSLEKLVFSIIMGILVVVAAFNIIGVLVLLICYRAHEVAILKALGMRQNVLQKIFTLNGVSTGFLGTVIGVGLGVGMSWVIRHFQLIHLEPEIYFLSALPIDISWPICGMIIFFSILMCYLTSRIAAKRLALMPIIEGL